MTEVRPVPGSGGNLAINIDVIVAHTISVWHHRDTKAKGVARDIETKRNADGTGWQQVLHLNAEIRPEKMNNL